MHQTAPPPDLVHRWERAADAARRLGFPSPALFRSEVELGRTSIRFARLGRRSMLHVAVEDVNAYAARLAAGESSQ